MADYKKFARPSGPRPQRAFSNNGPQQSREMYDAECSSCHDRCQVPFRPNGKKPVFCANCFTRDESRSAPSYGDRKSFSPRPAARPSFKAEVPDRQLQDLKRQMESMNSTLEKLVTAVDTFNRANALTKEIRKHIPEPSVEKAEKPKAAKKTVKAVKKASKPAKKTGKK